MRKRPEFLFIPRRPRLPSEIITAGRVNRARWVAHKQCGYNVQKLYLRYLEAQRTK